MDIEPKAGYEGARTRPDRVASKRMIMLSVTLLAVVGWARWHHVGEAKPLQIAERGALIRIEAPHFLLTIR